MKTVGIIGSGGHAKSCIDALEQMGGYQIEGLFDDFRAKGSTTLSYSVVGKLDEIPSFEGIDSWFIAVGDNYSRFQIYSKLQNLGLKYINIVHPSAVVSCDLSKCHGTVIMAGSVVNTGSYIGNHVIINTHSSIDHDNVISDFASTGPGVVTGGNVHIGRCSHVGIGATINNLSTIGEHTVIGAGSVILKFIAAYKLAYGVPGIEIKDRAKGEKYL